jgi:glycerol-3-phosphate acyltransferase PlsX
MKIAIDAMSGDLGSTIVVEACLSFLKKNKKDELYVVGKIEELEALSNNPQITLIEARETLEMTENILAIRRKKESSMVKAIMLAREGSVDAVLSCGNTGAYYASAMLFLKRITGVEKSCLMAEFPTLNQKGVMMLDVGANAENTAEQLVSFGVMGSIYTSSVRHIDNPKVALLNIGAEEHKGDEAHHQAYQLLKDHPDINFVGNIEGKEILNGDVDVIVTDGFSGNIALKTTEGTASALMKALKGTLMSSTSGKIGALIAKSSFQDLKQMFNTDKVGGALMIGFVKPVIKAHGASNALAFENAIYLALSMVENDVVNKMKEGLNKRED